MSEKGEGSGGEWRRGRRREVSSKKVLSTICRKKTHQPLLCVMSRWCQAQS